MNLAALVKTAMGAVPAEAKARVTFTKTSKTETESTGALSSTSTTVAGTASEEKADPRRYERLALVGYQARTLIFVPDTAGEVPGLGSTCTWGGEKFTVRDPQPIAPNGTAIASSVVISR